MGGYADSGSNFQNNSPSFIRVKTYAASFNSLCMESYIQVLSTFLVKTS